MKIKISITFVLLFINIILSGCLEKKIFNESISDNSFKNNSEIKQSTKKQATDESHSIIEPTGTNSNTLIEIIPSEDIETLINKNLDIILAETSNDYHVNHESELINAYPSEFAQIINLGEAALPYLEKIPYTTENPLRGIIARAIQYAINPNIYDLVFPSPDGKHYIKGNIYSFITYDDFFNSPTYGDIQLIECSTDSVIWKEKIDMLNLSAYWSPNSHYAAITYNFHWISYTNILDVKNRNYIHLPRINDLINFLSDDVPILDTYWREYFDFAEWISSDVVKIYFTIKDHLDNPLPHEFIMTGWYIYNLSEKNIIKVSYNIESPYPN